MSEINDGAPPSTESFLDDPFDHPEGDGSGVSYRPL